MLFKVNLTLNQGIWVFNMGKFGHILKYGVESTFGVEPLSGVDFGVNFGVQNLSELR